jgi:hypothetical protein
MSKTITLTISDEQWQQFKDAVANELITEEADFERAAQWAMSQAIERRIKQHKHPVTGLSKQMMTHYRQGETTALSWLSSHGSDRAAFEEAGRTWVSRMSRRENIRDALLQGWLATWDRWERRNQQHGHQNENMP